MTPEQTAIHEAGHVVVEHALGLALHEVVMTHDIVEQTGDYGYCTSPNPAFGYEHASRRERRATVRAAAIGCLAGLAAEHVFYGVPLDLDNENAGHDVQNVLDLVYRDELRVPRASYVGDDVTWAYINRLLREAARVVRRHRTEVQRVADELLKRGRLTGDDIAILLNVAEPMP